MFLFRDMDERHDKAVGRVGGKISTIESSKKIVCGVNRFEG